MVAQAACLLLVVRVLAACLLLVVCAGSLFVIGCVCRQLCC